MLHGYCTRFLRLTFLASLLLPAASHAAGLQTLEQGTWEMGRAMVGGSSAADSAATALYNPAAMTLLDEPVATSGVMAILGETRFDQNSRTAISGGTGGNQTGNSVVPGGLFAVYPVNEEWALGFALSVPFAGTLDPDDSWPGRYLLTKLELQTMRIGPSVAYRVNDWLSLAATVGFNYTTLGVRVAIPPPGGIGTGPDGDMRISDADQWALSWGVSAMIELTETTRLGLVYGSELDNDDLGGDIDINAGPIGLASAVDVRFKLPQFAVASLRQEIGDELVVFADVVWADFSEFESLEIDPSAAPGAVEISTSFKDTIAYGIGADYTLSPEWTLSAGISYASSPVSKGNRLVLLPFDRQIRYGTGVRYEFDETTTVGLSYEYLDLGSGKLTNLSAGETVSGKYHRNYVQFVALTLSKSF